jgi:hypothetical protein
MSVLKSQGMIIVALIAVAALASSFVYGVLVSNQTIPNTGNVKTVGVEVYWDSRYTQPVTIVNWGSLDPGTSHNFTVYVLNKGSVPLVLSMTTGNWNSSAARNYLRLSWNREGYVLNAQSPIQSVLTISVLSNVTGVESFGFDITITGTESG